MNKVALVEYLIEVIREKMNTIQNAMDLAQQSANSETKSTAGDKYETARAMAQNERDIYARQLLQVKNEFNILQKLDINSQSGRIIPGSLAVTSFGTFFVSVSLGMIQWDNHKIMVVSPASPAGKAIMGKMAGEKFTFQGKTHQIQSIN